MPRRPALKQRPDGRYACRYKDKFFYGSTSAEAYHLRDNYTDALKQGIDERTAEMTVARLVHLWATSEKLNISAKTYNQYATYADKLIAELGAMPAKDVRRSDLLKLISADQHGSASAKRIYTMTLRSIFKFAVGDHIILSSPAENIKPPKGTKGTHRAIEPWERELMAHMWGHRMHLGAMLMLYAGLRRGEALAFNIDRDADFDHKVIYVREAVQFVHNQPVLADPKTEAGTRIIPMLPPLEAVLRGHHGLAVSNQHGELCSQTAFIRMWQSYLYQMGVEHNGGVTRRWYGKRKQDKIQGNKIELLAAPSAAEEADNHPWIEITIRPHDLRHSFCTMLYDMGIDLKTAMLWMGHADQRTTLEIYTHLTKLHAAQSIQQAQKQVDAYLGKQHTAARLQTSSAEVNSVVKTI